MVFDNSKCVGWLGELDKHGNEVINNPRIVAIYCWSTATWNTPNDYQIATQAMNMFLTRAVSGSFIDGLLQYGVNPGQFVASYEDPGYFPTSGHIDNDTVDKDRVRDILKYWIDAGLVPAPSSTDDPGPLYFIFTPPGIIIKKDDETSGVNFGGYHAYAHYGSELAESNLFWVVIPWPTNISFPPTATDPASLKTFFKGLVNTITLYCGHEMVEACTDRDMDGYKNSDDCEIGDICYGSNARFLGWIVEKYYSNVHASQQLAACIGPPPNVENSYKQCLLRNRLPLDTPLSSINPFANSLSQILATS
jgi:hypothetical protein